MHSFPCVKSPRTKSGKTNDDGIHHESNVEIEFHKERVLLIHTVEARIRFPPNP